MGFGFGAAGEVDGCVCCVEDAGEFFADACVGAGDDVDLCYGVEDSELVCNLERRRWTGG